MKAKTIQIIRRIRDGGITTKIIITIGIAIGIIAIAIGIIAIIGGTSVYACGYDSYTHASQGYASNVGYTPYSYHVYSSNDAPYSYKVPAGYERTSETSVGHSHTARVLHDHALYGTSVHTRASESLHGEYHINAHHGSGDHVRHVDAAVGYCAC